MTKDRLTKDIEKMGEEAEDFVNTAAGNVSEKVREARSRLSAALDRAKDTYGDWREKAAVGAQETDRVIRDHPYQSIGIAFAVGLLIGVLVNRRNH